MDDFQSIVETSLSQYASLVKVLWRYDWHLLSGWARHCWCLAEACSLQMIFKILWDFLGSNSISGEIIMKIQSAVIKILG